MKIGIIGAMDEEISILKAKLNNIVTTVIAGCEFYQGELNGKQVILTKTHSDSFHENFSWRYLALFCKTN